MESRTITDLPEPIVMDILSRLPVKTIVKCRCICKTWLHLLLDPHFANIHFSRAPTQILGTPSGYNDHLFIGELDESLLSRDKKDILVCPKFTSIIKTYPGWDTDVANIANGFVCLVNGWNPCRILNPITGELIVVEQTVRMDCRRPLDFGLGFSKKTNELKLLRLVGNIKRLQLSDDRLEVDIYRLSTNSWRSIGEAPSGILDFLGPFVNGALHSWSSKVCDAPNPVMRFHLRDTVNHGCRARRRV
ncbi:hypothetical protein LguiA_022184 [Lonicera macranthoides]